MADDRNGDNRESESNNLSEKQKDGWYKAAVLSKFLTAILVVIIGLLGNHYLQQKQKNDSNLKLYTQLLSNKETSENTLRKDMFVKILESFLKPKDDENKAGQETLSRIREMRLNLELLSRNFHESLDMKPLFKHLLMEIIRPRIKLKGLLRLLEDWETCKTNQNDNSCDPADIKRISDDVKRISRDAEKLTNKEIMEINSTNKNNCSDNIEKVKELLKQYNRELDLLIQTAKRVTRKQREILEDVSGELRLTIDLKGEEPKKICTTYRPHDSLPRDGKCKNKQNREGKTVPNEPLEKDDPRTVQGVEIHGELWFINSEGIKDKDSIRYFLMRVRYLYPRWKQVYVEILTCPIEEGEEMTEKTCAIMCKKNPKINNKASFWLEYFDFPLVDNTYINSEQRYSVILEGFETDEDGNDEEVKITLLYYPSSYSGLREKSFYNTQLMRGLLRSDFFQNETDQKGVSGVSLPVLKGPIDSLKFHIENSDLIALVNISDGMPLTDKPAKEYAVSAKIIESIYGESEKSEIKMLNTTVYTTPGIVEHQPYLSNEEFVCFLKKFGTSYKPLTPFSTVKIKNGKGAPVWRKNKKGSMPELDKIEIINEIKQNIEQRH